MLSERFVESLIKGWDTTITLSNGAGQATIFDEFNSLELVQVIANPSSANAIYDIDVFNNDFNLTVFARTCNGKYNELVNLPLYGSNDVRISSAVPTTGTITVAMRFRSP